MITAILSVLGSSAFGSIIGGVFAWLNRKADAEAKRAELEHEARRWDHDLRLRAADMEMAKAEAAGRREVAIIEGDAQAETARMQAIGQSHEADRLSAEELKAAGGMRWLLVLVAGLNKLVRPLSTLALGGCALYLNWILIDRLGQGWGDLTLAQRFEAGMQAFAWVTGQASAAFGYIFVSRGTSGRK